MTKSIHTGKRKRRRRSFCKQASQCNKLGFFLGILEYKLPSSCVEHATFYVSTSFYVFWIYNVETRKCIYITLSRFFPSVLRLIFSSNEWVDSVSSLILSESLFKAGRLLLLLSHKTVTRMGNKWVTESQRFSLGNSAQLNFSLMSILWYPFLEAKQQAHLF